ncbi:hypothetical protein P9139_04550 [Curtobacterium flaccumfaciens]|nr:hypothetical protein P9139_04550 [Curtobacterium flaccumfaciens]
MWFSIELRAVGVGTETTELSALGRGATLRRQAEDELRLAAAAYIASAARRPGTIVNGGIAALYGVGLFVGAVALTVNRAVADPSAAIAVLILGVAGIAISAYGISSVVRRVKTRSLRLASGLPDPLTRDAFLAELRSEGSPLKRSARATLLYMEQ